MAIIFSNLKVYSYSRELSLRAVTQSVGGRKRWEEEEEEKVHLSFLLPFEMLDIRWISLSTVQQSWKCDGSGGGGGRGGG